MDLEDLDNCPGIFIPCENIEVLQSLVLELFRVGILHDDETFKLVNVPEDIYDMLNDPSYFEPLDICGFEVKKGNAKELDQNTEDLL